MSRSLSRASALGTALALISVLTLPGAAMAQQGTTSTRDTYESFGLRGFGVRAGLVDPENASSTILLGAHLDCGQFVPNLRVTPFMEYWSVGVGDRDRSDLAIGANLDYDFPLAGPSLTPYAGAGLAMHRQVNDRPDPLYDVKTTRLGLNVQGGVRDHVMPNLSLFGEIRFTFVEDTDNWRLLGGFTYNFIY